MKNYDEEVTTEQFNAVVMHRNFLLVSNLMTAAALVGIGAYTGVGFAIGWGIVTGIYALGTCVLSLFIADAVDVW